MRAVAIVGLMVALAGCKDDTTAESSRLLPGQPGWTSSAGEVALTDGETLEFTITSERYKAWDAARQGIDRRVASRFGAILNPASPSRRSIERAVAYLESEPAARDAIEQSGLSVRDFVVTTVALEQEMRLASARGELPPDTLPAPYPGYQPYPYDTSGFAAGSYLPSPPPVVHPYLDTFPRPDTSFRLPRRDSIVVTRTDTILARRFLIADSIARAAARRDSMARSRMRRDSVLFRRDTVGRRDTTARRDSVLPPRDTTRDTIPASRSRP